MDPDGISGQALLVSAVQVLERVLYAALRTMKQTKSASDRLSESESDESRAASPLTVDSPVPNGKADTFIHSVDGCTWLINGIDCCVTVEKTAGDPRHSPT